MTHSHNRELLFSVRRKDLKVQFFRAGGKGGQKQNKTSSACRITHPKSGAVGASRNHRTQTANKREALNRLANSKKFLLWVKLEASSIAKDDCLLDTAHPWHIGAQP